MNMTSGAFNNEPFIKPFYWFFFPIPGLGTDISLCIIYWSSLVVKKVKKSLAPFTSKNLQAHLQPASVGEGLPCSHSWAEGQQTFYRAQGEMNFYKKREAKCQILKKSASRPLMVLGTSQDWVTFLLKESCIMKHTEKICRETDSSVYFVHGTIFIQRTEGGKKKLWTEKKGGGLPITP